MKEVFITPPNSHLELTEKGTNNFYCLGQIYIKNPKYREYALQAKKDGRFIILDSGVGDHGTPIGNKELVEIAKELVPDEVIPLDTLYNSFPTMHSVVEMAGRLWDAGLSKDVKILGCPQGSSLDDWMSCYMFMLESDLVSTIGLSKKTIPYILFKAKEDDKIPESRHIIYDILKYHDLIKKPIHLLGSAGPWEYEYYKGDDMIRSTDSCICVWSAMAGESFKDKDKYNRVPTPPDYFEREISGEVMEKAEENIRDFYKIATV